MYNRSAVSSDPLGVAARFGRFAASAAQNGVVAPISMPES